MCGIRYIVYEIKQLFCSATFWIAVILETIFIFFNSEIFFNDQIDYLELLDTSFDLGLSGFITPVLVSLPFVTRFYEEKTNGNYIMKITRHGTLKYASNIAIATICSGMLVMLFSLCTYTVVITLFGYINGYEFYFYPLDKFGTSESPTFYLTLIERGYGWFVYCVHIFFLCCYGGVWAGIGVLSSVFVANKMFAVVFPFLVKRLSEFFLYYSAFYPLLPIRLTFTLETAALPLGGFLYLFTYTYTLYVVVTVIIYFGMKWYMGEISLPGR